MTPKHVNPGQDTTINPIVINDSYRSAPMTPPADHDPQCFYRRHGTCPKPFPPKFPTTKTQQPQQPLSNMTDEELSEHMHKHIENMREEYPDQYHNILADGMIFHIADMAQRIRSRPAPSPDKVKITYEDGAAITGHELRLLNWVIKNLKDERLLAPLVEIKVGIRKREETYESLCNDHDTAIAAKAREDDIKALESLCSTRQSRYEDPEEPEERREFLRGMMEGTKMARGVLQSLRSTTTKGGEQR
jgi:hypothetical protein